MLTIDNLLQEAVVAQASDIHLTSGVSPIFRIRGVLTATQHQVLNDKDTEAMVTAITNAEQKEKFQQLGELDFSYAIVGLSRFRINTFRQRSSCAIAIRVVAEQIPTLEQLGHREVLKVLARKPRGLVLVTGPTGSGKSTTLAAMLDLINTERACHIITLEDPIEYLHRHKKSIVNQREINTDTKSFANALRAALREDPDVILVGEMRDAETIGIAITAAETGHLVFATLHTSDAAQTIDRIIDVFPPYQQQQIRTQLSLTLQGIVAQQLLPCRDDLGRVAAMEVLMATPAVRNIIREGKTQQLVSVIQTGAKTGMQAMDMSLRDLYWKGIVTYEEALARAMDQETFVRLVNG
ncbi:Twitching mobility protein [Sporomusa ovata DSM 2662]|uniref:Twitching motility protein PilT n=1 Tax=Sporomusa ovata TaxID=2378 RepID=A0A0U1KUY2_9FIRM|nr:type IV pilus twitching motility protein PilT [Sporomusa ovata]EQB29202.1 twitching mobility protein PilT [Sporomusa ovata DSM 2662]CQR71238.1 Twitching motility protein PilT [Sporomusa ovata]